MAYKPHLIWAKYGPDNKYYLMLYVGDKADKAVCIDSKSISNTDADSIREISKANDFQTMEQFLFWVKKFLPHLFYQGYKEFTKTKLEIVNSYDL